jgi:hypothetical protein
VRTQAKRERRRDALREDTILSAGKTVREMEASGTLMEALFDAP